MQARVRFFPILLLSASMLAGGCSDSDVAVHGPTPIITRGSESSTVSVQPAVVAPQTLGAQLCPTPPPPFGVRLTIDVTSQQNRFLNGVRFEFVDEAGRQTVPIATALPTPSSGAVATSSSVPLPLPTSMPIPFPSSSPIPIPGSSRLTLPVFLQFNCGVLPSGRLVVFVETGNGRGDVEVSQVTVRIGR